VTKEAIHLCKKLLEKNRAKRPSLEETLQHPWFACYKEIHEVRSKAQKDKNGLDTKFEAFTITDVSSKKIDQD
jgi:serine/threonine protein kinase